MRKRKAGEEAERQAAYEIDFHFSKNDEWAVIHGIRLEHEGRSAQIDHLLVNRHLVFVVLETKSFKSGLMINDAGEFHRWDQREPTKGWHLR